MLSNCQTNSTSNRFEIYNSGDGLYRVIGLFRDGTKSLLAVPSSNDASYSPWLRWVSETEAKYWVDYLNKLEQDNLIDWSQTFPSIRKF